MSKPPRLQVTDHALVRWLERAGGLDVETLRAAVAQSLERAYVAGRSISDGRFVIRADGMTWLIAEDRVVTLKRDDGRTRSLHEPRGRRR